MAGESLQQMAWLIRTSGVSAGKRYPVRGERMAVGRDPHCEMQPTGEEAAFVSSKHAEIRWLDGSYSIRDLGSRNGTLVDGDSVSEAVLASGSIVQFGSSGPEFRFELSEPSEVDLGATLTDRETPKAASPRDKLLASAVGRARRARNAGFGGQTTIIMRDMLDAALEGSGRRHRRMIRVLVAALVIVAVGAGWRIWVLQNQKRDIDQQIANIEATLEAGGLQDDELQSLIGTLNQYQAQAEQLQDGIFYRFGVEGREKAFVDREIRALMAEFGAEQYSIPPEFNLQVRQYVDRFASEDRPLVEKALGSRREDLQVMREIFEEMNLPADLVYMVLVESSFITQSRSRKGAVGLWQFTPATARAYGLRVDGEIDERHDLEKSTRAAGRYVRDLILDFGSGSSVMLALAAYNLGPGKVKRAVRKVQDPIQQRNFWYLYRVRALPRETRQYVPKIIGGIIVGRNLDHFGF